MPMNCAVAVCPSPPGISYFRFPKDPKLRKSWSLACKRKDTFNEDTSRICENHFVPNDFERDFRSELMNLPVRKSLKEGSIPSVNLSLSKSSRQSNTEREDRAAKRLRKDVVVSLLQEGKFIFK
jgi:hypothetical protein